MDSIPTPAEIDTISTEILNAEQHS
jgi:hypothetical protein